MKQLANSDILVFFIYFIIVAGYGYWIYRRKKAAQTTSTDFFLAEGQLTWWAIGASLIASNISAEQFIGMSGNGFRLGIAISAYEWLAAVSLVIVAVFFMPIYLKNRIFTMPQFLKTRYNETVAMIMAVFWLFLYIFVNLTSILYLGTIAINSLTGGENFHWIMIGLAVFALVITLGGMKVIGYTDVIQVLVLLAGGLITSYIALTVVSEKFGYGKDFLAGFNQLLKTAPDHFKMIFDKPRFGIYATGNKSLFKFTRNGNAGCWYVGCEFELLGLQPIYNTTGIRCRFKNSPYRDFICCLFKIIDAFISCVARYCAFVLHQNGDLQQQMLTNGEFREDNAYSAILGFLPAGLKGLSMAALTAAIVASLAGKANSISTIYTLDIYKKYINKGSSEKKIVWMGRLVVILALIIAIVVNWQDSLGIGGKGGFEFIQKYTGYISPAIFPVFLFGFFWKKTTSKAAIAGIIGGVLLAVLFDKFLPGLAGNDTLIYTAYPTGTGAYEIPFLIQMGWVFFFTSLLIIIVSLLDVKGRALGNALQIDKSMYKVTPGIMAMIIIVLGIIVALYIRFW